MLMTHLEVYNKINQLPPNMLDEVENYINFLLQKYQKAQFPNYDETEKQKQSLKTISPAPNLPKKLGPFAEQQEDTKDDNPFLEKLLTVKISAPSDFAENLDAYLTGEKII